MNDVQYFTAFPRKKNFLYAFARQTWHLIQRATLRLLFRLKIDGREHLPMNRSFVIVANHASNLDSLCVQSALPWSQIGDTYTAAASEHFFQTRRRAIVAAILGNALPFHRERNQRVSLRNPADLLQRRRQRLILFPEGTRSFDGDLGEFERGIGWIAAGKRIPVIPAYIDGAYEALPRGARRIRRHPIRVRLGAPLHFDHLPRNKPGYLQVTSDLRSAVLALKPNVDDSSPHS